MERNRSELDDLIGLLCSVCWMCHVSWYWTHNKRLIEITVRQLLLQSLDQDMVNANRAKYNQVIGDKKANHFTLEFQRTQFYQPYGFDFSGQYFYILIYNYDVLNAEQTNSSVWILFFIFFCFFSSNTDTNKKKISSNLCIFVN